MRILSRFIVLATVVSTLLLSTYSRDSRSVEAEESVDPVQVAPLSYKVILDNDYVRMLEISTKPGDRDEMHSHPVNAWYAIKGAKIRLYTPDGESQDVEITPGMAKFQDAVAMHSAENIGDTDLKLIMVELKDKKPPAIQTSGPDPVKVSPGIYKIIAENELFRIVEITAKPGEKDEMHGHPANVYYVLSGAEGTLYTEEGEPKMLELKEGMASFQEPVEKHQFENSGDTDIRVIMFELKNQ
jgi:beta-alanine degradation protein BauB